MKTAPILPVTIVIIIFSFVLSRCLPIDEVASINPFETSSAPCQTLCITEYFQTGPSSPDRVHPVAPDLVSSSNGRSDFTHPPGATPPPDFTNATWNHWNDTGGGFGGNMTWQKGDGDGDKDGRGSNTDFIVEITVFVVIGLLVVAVVLFPGTWRRACPTAACGLCGIRDVNNTVEATVSTPRNDNEVPSERLEEKSDDAGGVVVIQVQAPEANTYPEKKPELSGTQEWEHIMQEHGLE